MSQEIIAVLDKIAQYLGTTSEKVLEIITRMAFADAIIASVLIIVCVALSVTTYQIVYKLTTWIVFNEDMDDDIKGFSITGTLLVGIPIIITLIALICSDIARLSGFFSPELWAYYALLPKLMK